MYFSIDENKKRIINEDGDEFTADQFKKIIERNAAKNIFFDMTMATARFIRFNYDWEALKEFYDNAG